MLILSYGIGDELRLRYLGDMQKPWSGVGHVIKVTYKFAESQDSTYQETFLLQAPHSNENAIN